MCALAIPPEQITYDNDLGIQYFNDPNTGVNLTATEDVNVTIKNYGLIPQTDFDVSYIINGSTEITETISTTLNAGDTLNYTFSATADLLVYGTYQFEVCVILSGDENNINDCKEKTVENLEPFLCVPEYINGCMHGNGFKSFVLEQIENLDSGCEENMGLGWSQYFDLGPAVLSVGNTYTVMMESGWPEVVGMEQDFATIWIDFDDDLIFSEDEQIVFNVQLPFLGLPEYVDFTLPEDANTGLHVMRARTNYENACLDPCEYYYFGEAEDYMVEVIVGSQIVTQVFDLETGYQFISSGVIPPDPDMTVVMADVLNDNLAFVRSSTGTMLRKIGPTWVNSIGDWIVEEGYLVKMNADDSFSITGTLVDPTTPILVETGYQFVSYFPETSMDALIAFETIIGDDLDFIRDSQGNMLRKIGPNWVNGIGDAMPTEGYLVKMFTDGEIIYPAVAKSSGMTKVKPSHLIFEGGNAADPVYTIYISGLNTGDEVAAYDGNVMVGSTVIVSENTLENALPIFRILTSQKGYVNGNSTILKVWDNQLQSFVSSTYTFIDEYEEAYYKNTYPVEDGEFSVINITKGSSDNLDMEANVSIYPNPATDALNVVANTNIHRVRIINFIGQVMFNNEINNSSININTSAYQSGVYIISVETSNGVTTEKITIK
jgi:hypothetical protein